MKHFVGACVALVATVIFVASAATVTNDVTTLYERMLRQPTGESLLDVEMACQGGRWDRATVALLAKELAAEKRELRFEDERTDTRSLAAHFLAELLAFELPGGSQQPPCLIRCRLVPDATEVHRNFKSPHRVHIFRLTESGCSFAREKAEAYLQSAGLPRKKIQSDSPRADVCERREWICYTCRMTFFEFIFAGVILALVVVGVGIVLPVLVRRRMRRRTERQRIQAEIDGKDRAHFKLDRAKRSDAKRKPIEAHTMPLGVKKLVKTGSPYDRGVMG